METNIDRSRKRGQHFACHADAQLAHFFDHLLFALASDLFAVRCLFLCRSLSLSLQVRICEEICSRMSGNQPVRSFSRVLDVCLIPASTRLVQKCMKWVGVGFHLSRFLSPSPSLGRSKLDVILPHLLVTTGRKITLLSLNGNERKKGRHMSDTWGVYVCLCVVVVEIPHRGWTGIFLCRLFDLWENHNAKSYTGVTS